tara:strand:+ start:212 stop:868 length:657 start_codon:yes stop_codon:yes gene_type:complete
MSVSAIKQLKSGKNIYFITNKFNEYSLEEIILQGEKGVLENITIVTTKSGEKYIRSKPNQNKKDNLDRVAITCNDGDYLLFDREYLYLRSLNGRSKKKWKAFSGNSKALIKDQDKEDYGPLPEGEYEVYFGQSLDYQDNTGVLDALLWWVRRKSWGYIATPLKQISGTSYSREHFYIHGGEEIGTKGCIEVNGDLNKNFHAFMRLYNRNFRLVVKYKK